MIYMNHSVTQPIRSPQTVRPPKAMKMYDSYKVVVQSPLQPHFILLDEIGTQLLRSNY